MAVFQLPTGTYETRAAFAYTGGSFGDKRRFAATAVLVTHPRGDFLIDAGFGAEIAAHVRAQPWFARAPYTATRTASEQLDVGGYDRARLRGVLITHSHWDHVSGLDQLLVPIWTNAGELQYAAEARDGTVFRTVSKAHEVHRYEFAQTPYLGFPASYDLHGDGSLVLALAGGHTSGSVIVFVTLPTGQRYAFIGDVTWQLEGITKPAERPLLMRKLADVDPGRVREDLLQVASLAGLMQVVPAHDVNAYAGIPPLPAR
jgi:glyoxylase-like metal-dependent hydrolase (beta-lactamase superfamily II)